MELVVNGVTYKVREVQGGFEVDVEGHDEPIFGKNLMTLEYVLWTLK